ncbi:MAG: HAD family hydrolase, partial [Chloroflexia bacterium]|nr:HAD family hydrolase [Chloroflexia bacterium]
MRDPMGALVAEELRLVHAVPGRVRLHLPGRSGHGLRHAEVHLRQVPGVQSVQGNSLTGNVLVHFDPIATDEHAILGAARASEVVTEPGEDDRAPALPPALQERYEETTRARIAVRGLDRDPVLARRIVERLEHRPGVQRVTASPLTGRVLVEFAEPETTLDDLLGDVADLELPALPGENRPTHPLDSEPLVRNATRAVAAALGLGFLAVRRLVGAEGPPVRAAGPVVVAGTIGLLQGFPAALNGLRRMFGPDVVDAGLGAAGVVSLTLAGSPMGLALGGLQAARLFTEVRARRAAWRRHESLWERHSSAQPGAVIHLEAGERTPLTAKVREGIGVAVGRDGLPMAVTRGSMIPAGAPLYGGPFVLELGSGDPFTSQARPSSIAPSVHDRYLRATEPLSLAYAMATALLARSPARAFAALLLVNPLPAVVGAGAANAGASARVLRSGVTVVGTRPDRPVRLPGILLIDGPRVLTDGFELAGVVPLAEGIEIDEIRARAVAVAAASGSPWHGVFPATSSVPATDGAFDGRTATAVVEGMGHTLGPIGDLDQLPAAVRLQHRGDYLLLLHREGEPRPLGLIALRPRLAPGAAELGRICRRHRVEIGLLTGGDPVAARGVAQRAEVPLLDHDDLVKTVRACQARGTVVAVVSDTAGAAAAFAACDLAIGLTPGGGHLPARADLLAPDLGAVAAVVEAGAYREAAVRDAVALSAVANAVGAVWGFRGRPGVERTGYAVYLATFGGLAAGWARLRGGERPVSAASGIADPHPERWSRHSAAAVLQAFDSTETGLTSEQAAERRQVVAPVPRRNRLLTAVIDQLRSPLTGILAAGAGLSLILGAPADVVMIGAMVVANAAAGAWQESRANQAA